MHYYISAARRLHRNRFPTSYCIYTSGINNDGYISIKKETLEKHRSTFDLPPSHCQSRKEAPGNYTDGPVVRAI